jgi:hypothetical protein
VSHTHTQTNIYIRRLISGTSHKVYVLAKCSVQDKDITIGVFLIDSELSLCYILINISKTAANFPSVNCYLRKGAERVGEGDRVEK